MQTHLEIFYMRVMDDQVRYRRKQVNLSELGEDPDRIIQSLIQQRYQNSSGKVEDEFVIHSTSWRYTPPGGIIFTYVAYSDELEFDQDEAQNLALKELRAVTVSTPRPHSPAELEKHVVSHAMRHVAFLIKTDHQNALKRVLTPRTIEVFEALWIHLAGRVF